MPFATLAFQRYATLTATYRYRLGSRISRRCFVTLPDLVVAILGEVVG